MDDPRVAMQADLKEAMINKDNLRRDVIRMTLSAFKQVEVDERRELSADEVVAILQREIKKRRDSVEEARKAGRNDIADSESTELTIIEVFLPAQMSREEITVLAQAAVEQSGATSAKDMGKLMALLMPQVKGKADGKLVNEVVRELLS
jgi:hypothetical protein